MAASRGEGLWGMDKVDDSEPQRRTFFMWTNSKLEEGGHSRIGFDSMYDDFKNGVVLANLVSSLCDAKAFRKFPEDKINYNPRNPLHDACNVKLVFDFLSKVEKEDMSAIPTNTITKGAKAYVMGLIFKLILRYSISEPRSSNSENISAMRALLDWVQPKCVPHKDVKNFDTSWRDGKAIVALWNFLVNEYHPEYQIDMSRLDSDAHGAVNEVITNFQNHMLVEPYLTADMVLCNRPDKQSMMTYIAEVRDKHKLWVEEQVRITELNKEKDNEDNGFITEGDKWYKMGKDRSKEVGNESNELFYSIEAFANEKFAECGGADDELEAQFETVCEEARTMMTPVDDGYAQSDEYFENAKKEYKKVKDRTKKKEQSVPKIKDCTARQETNESLDDNFHKKVEAKLEDLKEKWRSKKILDYALEFFSNTKDTTDEKVTEIIETTIKSFSDFNYDRQRFQAVENGREEVVRVISTMNECKDKFEAAEPQMLNEEDSVLCVDKMKECDDLKATWLAEYDDACKTELSQDKYVSWEETTDLLTYYHDFSVQLERIISQRVDENGNLIAPSDDGVSTDFSTVKSRLDALNSMLKSFKQSEKDLRPQVHAQVDDEFDRLQLPGERWYKPNYDV
jgi:hypothetical protein